MDEKRRYEEGLEVAPIPAAPEVVPYHIYQGSPAAAVQHGQHITSPLSAGAPPYSSLQQQIPPPSRSYTAHSATLGAYSPPSTPPKSEAHLVPPSTLPAGEGLSSVYTDTTKRPHRTICGCSVLVFVLCAVIALLGAACIGLAAGTGIEASRANDLKEQLALMNATAAKATVTVTGAAAATASFNEISRGCSNDPSNVSGQSYTAPKGLGAPTFTLFCNKDATGDNLMSLFTSSLETCMDACASFTFYGPNNFGANATAVATRACRSVSFIPLWTDKIKAQDGSAPGNCYLKPSGTVDKLITPNIGTECHAALLSAGR